MMANPAADTADTRPTQVQQTGPRPTRSRGCMICRTAVRVESFHQLKPGDEIAMPGRIPLLGCLYEHHGVVAKIEAISDDGQTAKLTVVDVDDKGKTNIFCPCNRKPLPIKEHGLYDKENHQLVTRCASLSGSDAVVIRKITYRRRRFSHAAAVMRARQCNCNASDTDVRYCFCLQNCEHFAAACINGPENLPDSLEDSISVQALDCLWVLITVIFLALQAVFYGFNFWMYAVFVAKDPSFEFLSDSPGLRDTLEHICYKTGHNIRYFNTTCDWKIMGIFIGFFVVLFTIFILVYYYPQFKKSYLCKPCFRIVLVDLYFSRLVAFFIVESVSILVEDLLYQWVTTWKMNRAATITTLIAVSVGGVSLTYAMASVFTKAIAWLCCKCRCYGDESFFRYVRLRGWASWLWSLRCCCRSNTSRLYATDEMSAHEAETGV